MPEPPDNARIRELRHDYEDRVRALRTVVDSMRAEGHSDEAIARAVSARRRELAAVYKDMTPEPWRTRIHDRTVAVYGDPLGPTIEHLRAQRMSWAEIIDGAVRSGWDPAQSVQ